MIFTETLRMSLGSLWSHKVRSILTVLGVVIGISSVLAVVSLGASFEDSIVSQFDDLDQKTIFVVSSIGEPNNGPPDCQQYCNIFTDYDRQQIEQINGVERVVLAAEVSSTSITWKDNELTFEQLIATVPEADELRVLTDYAKGKPFANGALEVVIGDGVGRLLSGGQQNNVQAGDSLEIRMRDGQIQTVTIAGILAADESLFGDRNSRVYVPIDPFYDVTRTSPNTGAEVNAYSSFTAVAASVRDVGRIRDDIKEYFEARSDAQELKIDDQVISVATGSDIQESISSVFDQVTLFIAAIAVISLIVGAVGIANIMLVSVTERTREIGVMKAIGARSREVLSLFLVESILIGVAGALFGVALGLGLAAALVLGAFASQELAFIVPLEWIGISFAVGIGTGVVAGLLPALRATKVQPVVALQYE